MMTPLQIHEALKRIAKPFGDGAYGGVSITSFHSTVGEEVSASISFNVAYEHKMVYVKAADFDAAIAALDIAAVNTLRTLHATIVRKLALAIIDATADTGSCNAAALRMAGFSPADIERFSIRIDGVTDHRGERIAAVEIVTDRGGLVLADMSEADARRLVPGMVVEDSAITNRAWIVDAP